MKALTGYSVLILDCGFFPDPWGEVEGEHSHSLKQTWQWLFQ